MKTFNDLEFKPHFNESTGIDMFKGCKHAVIEFDNKYGVSVVFGNVFYSNGIDTFEVAVLHNGNISYNSGITSDVLGHQTKDEVTEIMAKVQSLKKTKYETI